MNIKASAFPSVLRVIRITPTVLANDLRSMERRSLGLSDSVSLVDHRATITPKTGPTANVYRHDPKLKQRLTEDRRKRRHDQEHGHDDRHGARQGIPAESIPEKRLRNDPWPRSAESPEEPTDEEPAERRRERRGEPSHHIEKQSCHEHRLASEAVGQRSVDELADAEAREEDRHDERNRRRVRRQAEILADVAERREHGIDRDGDGRRRGSHQHEELAAALASGRPVLPSCGWRLSHARSDYRCSSAANLALICLGDLGRVAAMFESALSRCVCRSSRVVSPEPAVACRRRP